MKRITSVQIPTRYGDFLLIAYAESEEQPMPHLALISGNVTPDVPVLVRIHSECMTGDLFRSDRCECGDQLHLSLELIGKHGGILLYLRQEGRGIGLIDKLKSYQLQDKGLNTVEANVELGHAPDERSFEVAVEILEDIGVKSVHLLTNNPEKIKAIEDSGIELVKRIPLIIKSKSANQNYLWTKKELMGHLLNE